MDVGEKLASLWEEALLEYQHECFNLLTAFTAAINDWANAALAAMPAVCAHSWDRFVLDWHFQGVELEDAWKEYFKEWLTEREREALQAQRTNNAARTVFAIEDERKALDASFDRFFADAEQRRQEALRQEAAARKNEQAEQALKKRKYILEILGADLNNIPRPAVDRLLDEGLIARTTWTGGLHNVQRIAVIELPRADGGTDALALRSVYPWWSPPHWEKESLQRGAPASKAVAAIDAADRERHDDFMLLHGTFIKGEMAAYEILASGGSWPLIVQGIDQFQTAVRDVADKKQHDSAIVALATEFYVRERGMHPEDAKKAAERFDELLPLIAGVGEAGLNKIKERLSRPPAGRGVWDEPWTARGLKLHKQHGENLPNGFPVIDKFEDGIVTSIKTMDLGLPRYVLDPAEITSQGKGYIDDLALFTKGSRKRVVIEAHQIKGKVLELIVPPKQTPAQTGALADVVQYGTSRGITVKVVKSK